MKNYKVKLKLKYEKSFNVQAESPVNAMDKLLEVYANTDLITPEIMSLTSLDCEVEKSENPCDNCDEDCDCCEYSEEEELLFDELY